jgi:hypothetical protein
MLVNCIVIGRSGLILLIESAEVLLLLRTLKSIQIELVHPVILLWLLMMMRILKVVVIVVMFMVFYWSVLERRWLQTSIWRFLYLVASAWIFLVGHTMFGLGFWENTRAPLLLVRVTFEVFLIFLIRNVGSVDVCWEHLLNLRNKGALFLLLA